jgi:uncharacterized protein YndB with AHSA1/START domain
VFAAWTTPKDIRAWYKFADDWDTVDVRIDLRVGGVYRIDWRVGDDAFGETGEYLEISPPEVLVYTVHLEGTTNADIERTVCRVEFIERGPAECEVVITEEGYPTRESRDMHASGWPRFLDRLDRMLA